jgi:phage head maturation protease
MTKQALSLKTPLTRSDESGDWVEFTGRALSFAPKSYLVTAADGSVFRESYQRGAFKRTIDRNPNGHHFYATHETKGQLPIGRTFFTESETSLDVRVRLGRGAAVEQVISLYELGYNNVSIGGWIEKSQLVGGTNLYTEVALDHLAFVTKGALEDATIDVVREELESADMEILRRMQRKLRLARAA